MIPEMIILDRKSKDLRSTLVNGTFFQKGQFWKVMPREVLFNSIGIESIIFETVSIDRIHKPHWFKIWLKAIRLSSLSLSLSPVIAALFKGFFYRGMTPSGVTFVCVFLSILFLQVAVNVLNDVEDHLRLVDRPGMVGGSGVIQRAWVSARELRNFGIISLFLGALFGLPVVLQQSWFLFGLGSVGALGALAYSGAPFSMKYRAWGDLLIFVLAGPLLVVGCSQAIFLHWDQSDLFLGLFFGFVAWATFHAKHLQSFETDKKSQVTTLSIYAGYKNSRHIFVGLYLLAYLSVILGVVCGQLPLGLILALLFGIPPIIKQVLTVYSASGPVSVHLSEFRAQSISVHFCLSLLALLGILSKI